MTELDDAIRERRSTRMFLPDKHVARDLVEEALALASCAPSSSNIQPWHVVFVSGRARDRLVDALVAEASSGPLKGPVLPEAFEHKHKEAGAQIYNALGIARDDAEGRRTAVLRNWEFFRAPLAGIVCMHQELGQTDAMSVGMFLQNLLLALTARGLGTCVQASVAAYPHIIREQLGIADEFAVLCGLAVGYPDPMVPVNHLRVGRDALDEKVVFVDD